jgi:hypothetical protein
MYSNRMCLIKKLLIGIRILVKMGKDHKKETGEQSLGPVSQTTIGLTYLLLSRKINLVA